MQGGSVKKCKIVLLGDQSVGKTSVINRFISDNFNDQLPTVGVDFVSKTVKVNTKTLRMQLWDVASQQRFHSLIPSYLKDCSAAIIVFDLTNENSLKNLGKWVDNARQVRGKQALIIVIGNKADLKGEPVNQNFSNILVDKIKELGLIYKEVSAKTGHNIKELFQELAQLIAGEQIKPNQNQNRPNLIQYKPNLNQNRPNLSQNKPNLSQNKPNLNQNQQESEESSQKQLQIQNNLCIVCMDRKKQYLNTKCFHLSICQYCSNKIKDICPICRTKGQFRKVFNS